MSIRLDIGCGPNKESGFIGIDRFVLPGVDIVADLNRGIPIATSSAELVYASHSLEHLDDLISVMQEVYRVCRHGAQICIVAPYNEQKLNFANPHHKVRFNEHTPRFWTNHDYTPMDAADYAHPQAESWPLGSSDHANLQMDIRLVRVEFFYFPRFRNLNATAQRVLRSERSDVCDQIMYHLVAWKSDDEGIGFDQFVANFSPFQPQNVARRRALDETTIVEDELLPLTSAVELFGRVQRANEDLSTTRTNLALANQELKFKSSALEGERMKVASLETSNRELRELHQAERARNEPLRLRLRAGGCAA